MSKRPEIEAMIDRIKAAGSKAEMLAACRALLDATKAGPEERRLAASFALVDLVYGEPEEGDTSDFDE